MPSTIESPAPRDEWARTMGQDPTALPYQSPEWLDAVCSTGRYEDASRLYRFRRGNVAVVPLVRASRLPRAIAPYASLPDGWGIGGVVAEEPITEPDLREILADLADLRALYVRIRPNPLKAHTWRSAVPPGILAIPRRVHVLNLDGGFDSVWKDRFASSTRTGIRRALKSRLEVDSDRSTRLIPEFYEVLEASVVRWAEAQNEPLALARWRFRRRDPIEKFYAIARHMGGAFRMWVARLDGRPVATSLRLIIDGGNANASRSAMIKELAGPVRANDLLQQLAIEDACNSGCRYFVLGESGGSIGIAKYKERFGAQPYDYHEYYADRWYAKRSELQLRQAAKRLIAFKDDDRED